ncbi:hypothetical protein [Streptomyces sp. AC495_CC817]|uniref:hypothetical protein n=1 Tax=Streptomyces sp. AC495_CC817 TaxID=2823900 RepID=UPI001C277A92|nr:hypothetical protein [Streptomyces sp. AC495_CC817]
MRPLLAFVAGILTGLAFARIPHYVGPLLQDLPDTPPGHEPRARHWHHGEEIAITRPDTSWQLGYRVGDVFPDQMKATS